METVKQISFVVPTDLLYLREVLGKYEQVKPESIDQRIWLECQLALAEGFTNAVRHAHKNLSPETTIELEIIINSSNILIKIWDRGSHQNLISFKELNNSEDKLKSGGRGLEILQKVTDELKYERCPDDRNCLTIKKNLKQ